MASPSDTTRSYRILFVCLGNICRSPAAEGIMRHLVEERGLTDLFVIDSAGTYGGPIPVCVLMLSAEAIRSSIAPVR